jgi:hypothetical protein
MSQKTYPKPFNAQRAARSALKNPKAVEGKDFETYKSGAEWAWRKTQPAPAVKAAAPAKPKTLGKRAQIEADAAAGKLPTPPDFSAETHARFRKRLAEIVGFAGAGDIKALKADTTEPKSSSRIALCRYRDLCIIALEARAGRKAAA